MRQSLVSREFVAKVLEFSYDMKMPPDFETEDFQHIGHVMSYAVNKAKGLCV